MYYQVVLGERELGRPQQRSKRSRLALGQRCSTSRSCFSCSAMQLPTSTRKKWTHGVEWEVPQRDDTWKRGCTFYA